MVRALSPVALVAVVVDTTSIWSPTAKFRLWVVSLQDDWPAAIVHCGLVPATAATPFLIMEMVSVGLLAGALVRTPVVLLCKETKNWLTAPGELTDVSFVATLFEGQALGTVASPYMLPPPVVAE
jgi:hypothetical protein